MASVVDVCNLALANIAQTAVVSSINPPDGSAEADHCARFYPVARTGCLAHPQGNWGFAKRRRALALLDTAELPDSWGYAYSVPSGCLRAIAVLPDGYTDDNDAQPFVLEGLQSGAGVIYTNVEAAHLIYTVDVTDTAKWSPWFTISVSWLLSHFLAGPITKDAKLIETAYKVFMSTLGTAAMADANQSQNDDYSRRLPPSIQARL